jgi:hypothetical protein
MYIFLKLNLIKDNYDNYKEKHYPRQGFHNIWNWMIFSDFLLLDYIPKLVDDNHIDWYHLQQSWL